MSSFLTDSIFSGGSTRLHSDGTGGAQNGHKVIRKSKSHGGLLSPLVQLVRDPVGTLSNAVSSNLRNVPETGTVTKTETLGTDAHRKQILYLRMNNAETYDEWNASATELDALEENDAWKEEDQSEEYDAALVAARLKELDDARVSCNVRRIHFQMRNRLARDLGGMGHVRLYQHSHVGTKKLIERYINSAKHTLEALLDVSAKQGTECPFTPRQILDQLKRTRASYGRSALLLSGGGTFGMNHIGVVKCLWDARLLPRVVSGASAGSIVSAVLCTKTDAEIPAVMHDFCHNDLDVFEKFGESESFLSKLVRMFKTGGLFDISHLTRVMKGILGDMTFLEAYNRTQRVLNIPVSTASHFELPRVLNYITSPHVIIWSAVCTSCSVPLVYKTATLLAKDPNTHKHKPWDPNPDATWIDGSVDNDLPMTRLAEMFDVNHFIVSQVNPHVVPFLTKDEEVIATDPSKFTPLSAGSGWLNSGLSIARGELVHRMQVLVDMGIMPSAVTKLKSVLSQRYSGDINIFPAVSLADFPRVLSNPTPEYMMSCMLAGQRATWPKISRIKNHLSIELALDAAVRVLEARAMTAEREQDRRNISNRPSSVGNDLSYAQRSKSSQKMTRFDLSLGPPSPVLRKSAPTSPLLSRLTPRIPPPSFTPIKPPPTPTHPSDKILPTPFFHILSPSSNAEDSSDRDYFAEVDSDTTSTSPISSPNPTTNPITNTLGPTLWPDANHPSPFHSTSLANTPVAERRPAPSPPLASGSGERRSGLLLNLTMTSSVARPSSPELRYKRMFHQGGGEANAGAVGEDVGVEQQHSRRGSLSAGAGAVGGSWTKGMLLRKLSLSNVRGEKEGEEEEGEE
ncbi:acyl transferase/acyl hydrolase/lysophospholipase [Phaeosphaeriaceae sp. PMI808]|nr:acyl transferase/acyl hydrolase/lysophospholipase [Phaeosphaeriaceae sp. PMI808]